MVCTHKVTIFWICTNICCVIFYVIYIFFIFITHQGVCLMQSTPTEFRRGALLLYVVIMLLHNHFYCFFAYTNHVESGCHSDGCLAVNLCRRRQAAVDCVDVHAACKAFYND